MGIVSLVFGLILIGFGLFLTLWLFVEMVQVGESADYGLYGFGFLILPVPLFVIGGLLLRKFDKDRKKEVKKN